MTDHSENRATTWMSSELKANVEDRIDWKNSSMSEWMRDGARLRMFVEDAAGHAGLDLPEDEDERKSLLREIAFAGVDAVAADE